MSQCAREADVIVNAADMTHRGAVEALVEGLRGTNKTLVHTSGSSIVSDFGEGEFSERIFEDDTPFTPEPLKAASVAINHFVQDSARQGVRGIVICPPMIYGRGTGLKRDSIQVPALIQLSLAQKAGVHLGRGLNTWSNVHIDDLVELYSLVIARARPGDFFFAEAGEARFLDIATSISRMLGYGGRTISWPLSEAIAAFGEEAVRYSGASNSRVRATRARRLGWTPKHMSLLQEIEQGSYREDFASPIP
ncbi:NAD-dependent epimerase/dehydratase family protein [Cystobacter ferrugineus]|uniref:NAD-dependent epimerase/dehydratase family protein n=1 Tax=Cystobacter ferrugineus TaxID=83449 RepID=UPI000AD900C1|nr:NAD-dependent epimerase/dehydratase family protein [Cystobacter ferrugineus]